MILIAKGDSFAAHMEAIGRDVRSILERGQIAQVVVCPAGKDRTKAQNALSHVWYGEIWKQGGEQTTAEARCFCKLHFGVPIMRAGKGPRSVAFRAMWDKSIKNSVTYECKLALMEYIAVTSEMEPDQMSEYLLTVQRHYAERGILLSAPSDLIPARAAA